MTRILGVLLVVSFATVGWSHAYLSSSSPADGEVIEGSVEAIDLEFTEGVEIAFSTFKLVRLTHDFDMATPEYTARLNAIAGPMVKEVLGSQGAYEGQVATVASPSSGSVSALTLGLTKPLAVGAYLLAWRVLSVDTHVLEGFITFTVR